MNCPELCTAAKCAELEQRINSLETQLSTLYGEFIYHTQLKTSDAHDFDVAVTGLLKYDPGSGGVGMDVYLVRERDSNLLTTGRVISQSLPYVFEWDFNAHKAEKIPNAHQYEPNVLIDVFVQNDGSFVIKSQVDNNFDEDRFFVDPLLVNLYPDLSNQKLPAYEIEVSLGNKRDSKKLEIPLNFPNSPTDIDLNPSLNIQDIGGNDYRFTLSVNGEDASDILNLPLPNGGGGGTNDPPETGVSLEGNFNETTGDLTLTVTVNGKSSTEVINLGTVDLTIVVELLEEIKEAVTLEISGQYEIGATITDLGKDGSGRRIVDYSRYAPLDATDPKFVDTNFTGAGLEGIRLAFAALDLKLTQIHSDLAKAVDPQFSTEIFYPKTCLDYKTRASFSDAEWLALSDAERDRVEQEESEKITEFIDNTPLLKDVLSPLDFGTENNKIKTKLPFFYANAFAVNTISHQINQTTFEACESAENEIITIVASEKDIARIKDKLLVLHFVTLNNYPTRSSNSNYRAIQIPAPLSVYDWSQHFENLRWKQGNLYAQMRLEGYKTTVSGWFENENAANAWFDSVLTLTTAIEENRIISNHSNPKSNFPVRESRPYRAFITEVGSDGKAVCLSKYQPIIQK